MIIYPKHVQPVGKTKVQIQPYIQKDAQPVGKTKVIVQPFVQKDVQSVGKTRVQPFIKIDVHQIIQKCFNLSLKKLFNQSFINLNVNQIKKTSKEKKNMMNNE